MDLYFLIQIKFSDFGLRLTNVLDCSREQQEGKHRLCKNRPAHAIMIKKASLNINGTSTIKSNEVKSKPLPNLSAVTYPSNKIKEKYLMDGSFIDVWFSNH